jgi:hypothetical protein
VEGYPPLTVEGLRVTPETAGGGGFTVSEAVLVTPANTPVIVTAFEEETVSVETVAVAFVAPAPTVPVAGTIAAAVLELDSETAAPPVPALPFRVIVNVEEAPPTTIAGFIARLAREAGFTVSVAVLGVPELVAEIVTTVEDATPRVVIVKGAVVEPADTVTEPGTVAAEVFELDSVTAAPPVGAAAERVTVPVEDAPETTEAGARVTLVTGGGGAFTVSVAVFVTPAYPAVIVTGVCVATALVVTVNVAYELVDPTVTFAGTAATAALELERARRAPPGGPYPVRFMVAVEGAPPTTAAGLRVIDERTAGLTVIAAVLAAPEETAVSVTLFEDATP